LQERPDWVNPAFETSPEPLSIWLVDVQIAPIATTNGRETGLSKKKVPDPLPSRRLACHSLAGRSANIDPRSSNLSRKSFEKGPNLLNQSKEP
jgi:hypothetical protein